MRTSIALLLISAAFAPSAHAIDIVVNTTVDELASGGCTPTHCTLRDALQAASLSGGDVISFDVSTPAVINLQSGTGFGQLVIDRPITINGPGAALLSIKGSGADRVVLVESAPVAISGVQIAHGVASDASTPGANAKAGCVAVAPAASLLLDKVDVRDCLARGTPGVAGDAPGVSGTNGGYAIGGAVYSEGALTINASSIMLSAAIAGNGGRGGDGDTADGGRGPGGGGSGGIAAGGAIFIDDGGSLLLRNSTIAISSAQGGLGGDAGNDASDEASGGPGGNGVGGNIFVSDGAVAATIEFSTIAHGNVMSGEGGDSTFGFPSPSGLQSGSGLFANGRIDSLSTIVAGAQDATTALCDGTVSEVAGSLSLDDDGSCGFSLSGVGAEFRRFDTSAILASYMPAWQSFEIDMARSCNDSNGVSVDEDQNGTPRPEGSRCDLGAVEADYIFVGSFD